MCLDFHPDFNKITPMTNIVSLVSSTNTTPQTVILDMLQGVKVASGEAFEASKASLGKAAAFAYEQAPLLVQEFLTWKVIDNLFIISLMIFSIVGLCYLAKWVHTRMPKVETESDAMAYVFGVIFPLIIWVTAIVYSLLLQAISFMEWH